MSHPGPERIVIPQPIPTDGSWWVGLDRSALSAYANNPANIARMKGGKAAAFVIGAEGWGTKGGYERVITIKDMRAA